MSCTCRVRPSPDELFCAACGGATPPSSIVVSTTAPSTLVVGDVRFTRIGVGPVRGRKGASGRAERFAVSAADHGLHLEVGDVRWADGKRSVVAVRRRPNNHDRFDALVHRLPLPIRRCPDGDAWFYLRQGRYNGGDRPNVCNADAQALAEGAGVPVLRTLEAEYGAEVGSAGELIGVTGRSAGLWTARCPDGNWQAPLAAYALTRLLPVLNAYRGPGLISGLEF